MQKKKRKTLLITKTIVVNHYFGIQRKMLQINLKKNKKTKGKQFWVKDKK